MSNNILKHESDVWRTADLLIGAGIKQSDFPKYMMPYFALLMVESRLIREAQRLEEEIGKDNIDDFVEEFQLAKAREVDAIQRQNVISLTDEQVAELGIDNNVMRRLITDAMVKYLAKTYDFDVSEEKIISYVKKTPYFRNQAGEFDLSVFKAAFDNSPRKENEYLTSVRDQVIYSSMASIFMDSFVPSSALKDNMVDYMAETRAADLISINLDHKSKNYKNPDITSEQLGKFYESNKVLFVIPELRSFDYIVADANYLKKKLQISDAELEKYFNDNRDDFSSDSFAKAKKQVREVFVQEKMEELASELAKNLEEDVSSGLNIAEIAKKYNISLQSQKDISLADMNSSKKVEQVELADSVFELIEGEVSYPIEIQDQNNIMLVELKSITHSRQQELSEVEGEVKKILNQRILAFENAKTLEEFKKSYDPKKKQNKSTLKAKGIVVVSIDRHGLSHRHSLFSPRRKSTTTTHAKAAVCIAYPSPNVRSVF